MDDLRTPDPQEPLDVRNRVKDGPSQSQVHQHRIEHATTATVDIDRYTTICIIEIRPTKDDTATATNTIHHRIFDAIKEIEKLRINHDKDIPTEEEYKKVLKDYINLIIQKYLPYCSFLTHKSTISHGKI